MWSVRPVDGDHLPEPGDWQSDKGGWCLEQAGSQIDIWPSDKVWPEDIPDGVGAALPGIAFLTRMTVSGDHTKTLLSRATKTAKALASGCHGIVFDPQKGSLLLPSGVRRFTKVRHQQGTTFSITKLSWWTLDGAAFTMNGLGRLVATLERLLPEALPRRYGLSEPPQHVYAQTGWDHFIRFLDDHASRGGVIWYPTRPVLDVWLSTPGRAGPTPQGFRAHHVSITIDSSVLDQPGWDVQLRLVWRAVSKLLRPFYGDVRTLAGYTRVGGTFGSAPGAEPHPVNSGWWRGLPATPASAVVIGPDYQRIWPDILARGAVEDGLVFLDGTDWRCPAPYVVPTGLAQRDPPPFDGLTIFGRRPEEDRAMYAETWPFKEPLSAR